MRLWSIHPKYLDSKGITAVWREGLLAKKVLSNYTKGYRNHPQLVRFKLQKNPVGAIDTYLYYIWKEAEERGYHFKKEKIGKILLDTEIEVTKGQIIYEFELLKKKILERNPNKYRALSEIEIPKAHPLFVIKNGPIENWEKLERK